MSADCRFAKSDRSLAMRNHAKQTINCQVQQDIDDNGDNQRDHQRMTSVGAGTGDNAAKWSIERIGDRDYEPDESRSAARRQKSQQESQPEQSIEYEEQ